jgi:hypothetical protein
MNENKELVWIKSSFSGANGSCVELAAAGDVILLRNSNTPEQGVIRFTGAEMTAFVAGCRAGEFDDLGG